MFIALRFFSLRAPEERNMLFGEQIHAAPTERDIFKIRRYKHLAPSEQGISKAEGDFLSKASFSFSPGFSPVLVHR
jgi:hypothetical protein